MTVVNPCVTCGACCAYFRVSFYWAESELGGGLVPDDLTAKVNDFMSCMKGTESRKGCRCVSLSGDIGKATACTMYEKRPSPCREFEYSGYLGIHNPDCDKARAFHGLAPLPIIIIAPAA
ncbi:YkgJ family cysteine cluster protein [Gallaecimonas mangrovi]|uniref:YkgJ family cysteine cluster protein n=1 Tax=Gallaecimonas mangrovi TaxID=2291597 RepID=UPI000E208BC5|nr:YkgJ family cysteine cluster protein [Gallaecimonas mangrovi]